MQRFTTGGHKTMDISQKEPDRIYVTKEARDLIQKIDDQKFFGLNTPDTNRSELFLFAMSLGIDTVPMHLDNIYQGGLVLDKSIDDQTKGLMTALSIMTALSTAESSTDEMEKLDKATSKEVVYNMANEYANTGFMILEDELTKTKKDEDLIWSYFAQLNKQYSALFSNEK